MATIRFVTTRCCLLAALLFVVNPPAARAEDKIKLPRLPNHDQSLSPEEIISLSDLEEKVHHSGDWQDRTVVLVFVGLECPVANSYAPEVMAQKNSSKDKTVLWLGVHSDAGVTKVAAKKHAEEYKLTMPILLDSDQKLAAAIGAKKLGQVVVLQNLQVVYRGRIDDRFASNGKRRDEPSTHELRDVLAALADKKALPVAETEAYGCPIPFKK